ncbi:dicarboxylate transporter/tellurite-resistance protein TehA [Labrys miyagiensis]|uniref:Dicarboxylate transporter/tellurite-resistance protein TehA n=1 Tax=Labrys miyagiensis TaxID=346912 RepID=A0ABQ6CL75_9HYPH|nr:dicarboxylate transporter/tellurite-resistance protein TehA [Labrys miyagiensis]GLS20513.1 dicarboxylate transporter/tellurite-resistance protein TehA [Labrys miyagiensis]
MTPASFRYPPAAFFGIPLGLLALGLLWRGAERLWQLPSGISEVILTVGALVWALLIVLFAAKWLFASSEAKAEFADAIQCCFIGLAPVTTMLTAQAALPYSRGAALVLGTLGTLGAIVFAVYRSGGLWRGGRDLSTATAILYLPTVAGSFVTASTLVALGWPDWGQLAFGGGLFSWLAIESVLVNRLLHAPALVERLRPSLGIQLAPPAVGAVAYLNVSGGHGDVFATALVGYAILQGLILLRLLPWIMAQPFSPGYWGFSFGAAALPTAVIRLAGEGGSQPMLVLAPILFAIANIVIGILAIGSLYLLIRGRLLPPAPQPTKA